MNIEYSYSNYKEEKRQILAQGYQKISDHEFEKQKNNPEYATVILETFYSKNDKGKWVGVDKRTFEKLRDHGISTDCVNKYFSKKLEKKQPENFSIAKEIVLKDISKTPSKKQSKKEEVLSHPFFTQDSTKTIERKQKQSNSQESQLRIRQSTHLSGVYAVQFFNHQKQKSSIYYFKIDSNQRFSLVDSKGNRIKGKSFAKLDNLLRYVEEKLKRLRGLDVKKAPVSNIAGGNLVEQEHVYPSFGLDSPLKIEFSIRGSPTKAKLFFEQMKSDFERLNVRNVEFQDTPARIIFYCHPNEAEAILNYTLYFHYYPSKKISLFRNQAMSMVLNLGENAECQIEVHRSNINEKESVVRQAAKELISVKQDSIKTVVAEDSLITSSDQPFDILAKLLEKHQGICIGEYHIDISPKKILMDHFSEFYQQGVRILFLEHVFYDSMQPLLNEFFESGEMAPQLEEYLRDLDHGQNIRDKNYGYLALIKAAREAGIKTVAIDSTVSYLMGTHNPKAAVQDRKERYLGMNGLATHIIEDTLKKSEQPLKYIALVGNAHIVEIERGIPGIAELLGVPSVLLIGNGKSPSFQFRKNCYWYEAKKPITVEIRELE